MLTVANTALDSWIFCSAVNIEKNLNWRNTKLTGSSQQFVDHKAEFISNIMKTFEY